MTSRRARTIMYRRSVYGLTLACPFDLLELLPAPTPSVANGPAAVQVELGAVAPMTPVLADDGCRFWARGGEAKLHYDGVGTFHVIGGGGGGRPPHPPPGQRGPPRFL